MSLLNFWKKKESDLPMAESPSEQQLNADMPPIDAKSMGSSSTLEDLPTFDNAPQDGEPKSMSVSVPTLDFSMPEPDGIDDPSLQAPSVPETLTSQLPNSQNVQNTALNIAPINEPIDIEDLNKLFITDDEWKEPDWNNFEPYTEEKIEEPLPTDFKGANLPSFDDVVKTEAPMQENASPAVQSWTANTSEVEEIPQAEDNSQPFVEDASQFNSLTDTSLNNLNISTDKSRTVAPPVELFIRNKSYGKVFTELNAMNKALSQMDSRTGTYDTVLKSEEVLLNNAKEQMELIYKKFAEIDQKIFIQ